MIAATPHGRRRITVDPDALEDRAFTDGLTIEADGDWMVCVVGGVEWRAPLREVTS